jgi:homoserine kinase type II
MAADDDAGGGRRGLRPTVGPDLLRALDHAYGMRPTTDPPTDLGGSVNLNVAVTDGMTPAVARLYRSSVSAGRLHAIQDARDHLRDRGVPVAETMATRDGPGFLVLDDGRVLEVEAHVRSDAKMDDWPRLLTAMPVLGAVHAAWAPSRFEPSGDGAVAPFANQIASGDALDATRRGVERMRRWPASTAEEDRCAAMAEDLALVVHGAEADLADRLPRQATHGDFWDDNVLFREGRVVLVTDLDFLSVRPRVDDLALVLFYAALFLLEGGRRDVLAALRMLIAAYVAGLDDPLSDIERAALPAAIARQPLWSVGGWVAVLDDEDRARRHAALLRPELELALDITRDLERWREAMMAP